jgi:HEAT repeat protein
MNRKPIAVVVALTAFASSIFAQAPALPPEPIYLGKPLSDWLKAYPGYSTAGGGSEAATRAAYEAGNQAKRAVNQSGTNAIPTLLRMLRAQRDSNQAAFWGFRMLGTNAQSAVPALVEIVDQNISPTSQMLAINVLGQIGPPAKEAIPSLLRWSTNTDANVRRGAVWVLGRIHAEPDRVVPALISVTRDPNKSVQYCAIESLGRFGLDAKPAVPALAELLNSTQSPAYISIPPNVPKPVDLREVTAKALKAIDPEAAAKTGIK